MEGRFKRGKDKLQEARDDYMKQVQAVTIEQINSYSDIIAELCTSARWLVTKHIQSVKVVSPEEHRQLVHILVTLSFDHTQKTVCLGYRGLTLCDKDGQTLCSINDERVDPEIYELIEENKNDPLSDGEELWASHYLETSLRCFIIDYVTKLYKNSDENTLNPKIVKNCF